MSSRYDKIYAVFRAISDKSETGVISDKSDTGVISDKSDFIVYVYNSTFDSPSTYSRL